MYIYKTKIPKRKKSLVGIPSIYGIGIKTSRKIITSSGIGSKYRIRQLGYKKQYLISKYIRKNQLIVSIDLRKQVQKYIQHYLDIKSYRGNRHRLGYPVRGQRTHTNARTQKKLGSKRTRYNK